MRRRRARTGRAQAHLEARMSATAKRAQFRTSTYRSTHRASAGTPPRRSVPARAQARVLPSSQRPYVFYFFYLPKRSSNVRIIPQANDAPITIRIKRKPSTSFLDMDDDHVSPEKRPKVRRSPFVVYTTITHSASAVRAQTLGVKSRAAP